MQKENQGIEARKMEVGETIQFSDFIINSAYTRFGETEVVAFADESGKIIRKVFSNSLAKHLKTHKPKKYVQLKKKLVDGTMTFNVFDSE